MGVAKRPIRPQNTPANSANCASSGRDHCRAEPADVRVDGGDGAARRSSRSNMVLRRPKGHQNINGLLKWGAVQETSSCGFLNIPLESDAGTGRPGRLWDGLQVQINCADKRKLPRFSVLYIFDAPNRKTGPRHRRDGSRRIQLLASKDLGKHHFDVNEGVQFVGQGLAQADLTAIISRHFPIRASSRRKWGYTAEIAGYSRTKRDDACNP